MSTSVQASIRLGSQHRSQQGNPFALRKSPATIGGDAEAASRSTTGGKERDPIPRASSPTHPKSRSSGNPNVLNDGVLGIQKS